MACGVPLCICLFFLATVTLSVNQVKSDPMAGYNKQNLPPTPSRFHTYRVVLAEHDMNKKEGPEQFIMVSKMFIHPKWNDNCVSCG